jgi:hypothetical protein
MSVIKGFCAVLFLLFCNGAAVACECGRTPTVAEALEGADVVFAGKVISIRGYRASFQVERVWKGSLPASAVSFMHEIVIERRGRRRRVLVREGGCDFTFTEGESYLVYAEGRRLKPVICSRTTRLEFAKTDLNELGTGYSPSSTAKDRKQRLQRRRSRTSHSSRPRVSADVIRKVESLRS